MEIEDLGLDEGQCAVLARCLERALGEASRLAELHQDHAFRTQLRSQTKGLGRQDLVVYQLRRAAKDGELWCLQSGGSPRFGFEDSPSIAVASVREVEGGSRLASWGPKKKLVQQVRDRRRQLEGLPLRLGGGEDPRDVIILYSLVEEFCEETGQVVLAYEHARLGRAFCSDRDLGLLIELDDTVDLAPYFTGGAQDLPQSVETPRRRPSDFQPRVLREDIEPKDGTSDDGSDG